MAYTLNDGQNKTWRGGNVYGRPACVSVRVSLKSSLQSASFSVKCTMTVTHVDYTNNLWWKIWSIAWSMRSSQFFETLCSTHPEDRSCDSYLSNNVLIVLNGGPSATMERTVAVIVIL